MATIRTVVIECDMPHPNDKAPAQPYTFVGKAIGEYTIDLCASCAEMIFKPVMDHGQRTARPRRARTAASVGGAR